MIAARFLRHLGASAPPKRNRMNHLRPPILLQRETKRRPIEEPRFIRERTRKAEALGEKFGGGVWTRTTVLRLGERSSPSLKRRDRRSKRKKFGGGVWTRTTDLRLGERSSPSLKRRDRRSELKKLVAACGLEPQTYGL